MFVLVVSNVEGRMFVRLVSSLDLGEGLTVTCVSCANNVDVPTNIESCGLTHDAQVISPGSCGNV